MKKLLASNLNIKNNSLDIQALQQQAQTKSVQEKGNLDPYAEEIQHA
jgi:hypothetical protein